MRFARSVEPAPIEIVVGGVSGFLIDPIRLTPESRIDVHPGDATPIDIATKFDSEDECYAWSNLNYLSDPLWRHPDWQLPQGRYLVSVSVYANGQKCTGVFRLLNVGRPGEFRLEEALPGDAEKATRRA